LLRKRVAERLLEAKNSTAMLVISAAVIATNHD
jgi:pyruvate/2-oxoglutarate dehydrogenase complex dihydrolipoamide acyltransferase (E2) component